MTKEICIVAAIRFPNGYIIRGQRHSDCIRMAIERGQYDDGEQGFITSENRFVGRAEGYKLQKAAKIKSHRPYGYTEGRLYSEDLY